MDTIIVTYPTIREGASGEIVFQLQDLLIKAGSAISLDGKFGLGTRNAVRAFQKNHELPITGIADSGTWIKLMEEAGNIHVTNTETKTLVGFMQIPEVPEKEAKELMAKYPDANWAITGIK